MTGRTRPPATDVAHATVAADIDVSAEFDLERTHCLVIPDDAVASAQDGARDGGIRRLASFELAGRRYCVYARPGPGRAEAAVEGDIDPSMALTAREQQIVRLVCIGHVNKQIAHRLRISEYTVKTYMKQIFCKLNVHSRSAMVYRCASWAAGSPERAPVPSPPCE